MKVEKNIPLPDPKVRYPYESMEVGDSFFLPEKSLQIVCNANYRAGKRLNKKFIARKEAGGIRVWRMY